MDFKLMSLGKSQNTKNKTTERMGCICKLLSVVLFVIRKNGIQYLFQSVLRKTVIHNRICRFQEAYQDVPVSDIKDLKP